MIEDDGQNSKEEVQWDSGYKFKSHYKTMIERAEICIPNTERTALIIKSNEYLEIINNTTARFNIM